MAEAKVIAAAKTSALPAHSGDLRFPEDACDMIAPIDDAHAVDADRHPKMRTGIL
jgi:hypothetical protein